jgi:hypothetical protein
VYPYEYGIPYVYVILLLQRDTEPTAALVYSDKRMIKKHRAELSCIFSVRELVHALPSACLAAVHAAAAASAAQAAQFL